MSRDVDTVTPDAYYLHMPKAMLRTRGYEPPTPSPCGSCYAPTQGRAAYCERCEASGAAERHRSHG